MTPTGSTPLVLLLLNSPLMLALFALLAALLVATPAEAADRTFVFSPADVVSMIEAFNAEILARSGSFGRDIAIRGDRVRFFGRSCPALADGAHVISRVRILDSADHAGVLAGKSNKPNPDLATALKSMDVASWTSPAAARTSVAGWTTDTSDPDAAGFVLAGFANGDPTGAIGIAQLTDATPKFLVQLDLAAPITGDPASLVVAITTELPPTRPGKMPKRGECFVVVSAYPADLQTLVDLLARSPMPDTLRATLSQLLDDAATSLAAGNPGSAATSVKSFAVTLARAIGTGIDDTAAERLVLRALLVNDALRL
ncbi:MAG: hypothetical protein E6J72_08550 [Deltaproteobacteria bacterium]|nr:MAG: hypothetical protein E6J72_08550 [Deltaproteobacteria bacterium]